MERIAGENVEKKKQKRGPFTATLRYGTIYGTVSRDSSPFSHVWRRPPLFCEIMVSSREQILSGFPTHRPFD